MNSRQQAGQNLGRGGRAMGADTVDVDDDDDGVRGQCRSEHAWKMWKANLTAQNGKREVIFFFLQ